MEVLVFKTNIIHDHELDAISPILDVNPSVLKWNIDREDIDKVLRVETEDIAPHQMIEMIEGAGFFCEELPD